MRPTSWTDAHDRLMRAAAPTVPEPSADELAQVWARIAEAAYGEGAEVGRRRSRRRLRVGIAAGVGAVVLGTSGLAVAAHYTAHTGRGPADAEDLRLGGPGEKLALAAPDYGQVVAEETTDIPFPSEESRAFAVQDQVDDAKRAGTDEFVSTGAVRSWVASAAICSWANQWAVATRDGDDPARAQAIGQLQDAADWPAVTAIDPEPYQRWETMRVHDRQGDVHTERYLDTSMFFYLDALGEAVEGTDPAAVAGLLADNNGYCRMENVPDLPAADPMFGTN